MCPVDEDENQMKSQHKINQKVITGIQTPVSWTLNQLFYYPKAADVRFRSSLWKPSRPCECPGLRMDTASHLFSRLYAWLTLARKCDIKRISHQGSTHTTVFHFHLVILWQGETGKLTTAVKQYLSCDIKKKYKNTSFATIYLDLWAK